MRRILCEDPDGLRGKVDAVANTRQACEQRRKKRIILSPQLFLITYRCHEPVLAK
jgi:hypothetical protein